MVRWIFMIAWGMHGVGHIAGVTTPFLQKSGGFKVEVPWVLPGNVVVTSWVGKLWVLPWAAALVLTVASVYGLYTGAEWWRQAALFGAIASIVAIVPWARTVPPGALAGVALDLGVIVMLMVPLTGLLALIEK
jgi:hypothetical protein